MKDFKKKIRQAVDRFLEDATMRSHKGQQWFDKGTVYTLEFEEYNDHENGLECTTWGYDYSYLPTPKTYQELANLHHRAQLGMVGGQIPNEVCRRFYYEMMKQFQ